MVIAIMLFGFAGLFKWFLHVLLVEGVPVDLAELAFRKTLERFKRKTIELKPKELSNPATKLCSSLLACKGSSFSKINP